MSWVENGVVALEGLAQQAAETQAKLEDTRQVAAETQKEVEKLREDIFAFNVTALEGMKEVGDTVEQLPALMDNAGFQVAQRASEVGTKLDDLKYQLNASAEAGNLWAGKLLGIIAQVEDGTAPALAALGSMGNATLVLDGQLRSVRDVLNDVLPGTGEVQRRIKELTDSMRENGTSLDEVVARLRENTNQYAQDLAKLVEALKRGEVSIESVIRSAERVREALPSGETSALADLLADGLRQGRL